MRWLRFLLGYAQECGGAPTLSVVWGAWLQKFLRPPGEWSNSAQAHQKKKKKCDEKEGEEQEWLSSSLSPVVTLLSQLQTATDRSAAVRLSSLHVIRIHQAQVVRPTLTWRVAPVVSSSHRFLPPHSNNYGGPVMMSRWDQRSNSLGFFMFSFILT